MPYSSACFIYFCYTFLALLEIHSAFPDKPHRRATISGFGKLIDRIIEGYLQSPMQLEVDDELVEMVSQIPCCTSRHPALFLNYSEKEEVNVDTSQPVSQQ